MDVKDIMKKAAQVAAVCLAAVLCCLLLYQYDNKYTAPGVRGMNGVLPLGGQDVRRCTFLVDGWAVYGGVLLTPEDFARDTPEPDAYVFIGQYGGFEKLIGTPHGSVTYRLTVGIPEDSRGYTLMLPEIFSSCRVYINGVQRLALGDISPAHYRFETGSAAIAFDAAETIEILIAVSDFTHIYSGMVYPPAIGETAAVSRMMYTRFALRTAAIAAALIIGVISLFIGILSGRKETPMLYGLLCLLFIGYAGYPVTTTLLHGTPLLYAVETVSFCAMLLVVIAMQSKIFRDTDRAGKLRPVMMGFGVFVCLAAIVVPLFFSRAGLPLMMAYSWLITAYQWLTAGYITLTAGLRVWNKQGGFAPLLPGMLILDCTLVLDRVLHSFEPILSGWFPELGSLALVVSLGVAVTHEIIRSYRENAVMEERVRIIISSGREHYQKLNEMYDTLRILRHDYKYHLSVVRGALRSGNKEITDKMEDYLTNIEAQLAKNELQIFCKNPVVNALLSDYAERCVKYDIRYEFKITVPDSASIPDYEMCIMIGNLLENAVEACQKTQDIRKVKLVIKTQGEHLAIMVKNTFDGSIIDDDRRPVSPKKDGGFGLRSIEAVASRYEGYILTEWDEETFTTSVLLRV